MDQPIPAAVNALVRRDSRGLDVRPDARLDSRVVGAPGRSSDRARLRSLASLLLFAPMCVACGAVADLEVKDAGVITGRETGASEDAGHKDAAKPNADARAAKDSAVSLDASSADAGGPPTPVGTAIETGAVSLYGVTDDGYAIYSTSTAIKAALLGAGSPPITLVSVSNLGSELFVSVLHKDVFVWGFPNDSDGHSLALWTSALGTLRSVASNAVPYSVATSADGTAIVYAGSASTDGSSASLFGVTVASLASPTMLLSGIDVTGACGPTVYFTGSAPSLTALVGTCVAATTAGDADGPELVTAYPVATWTAVPLATGATSFWPDATGQSVAIALAGGQLEVTSLSGAPVVDVGSAMSLSATPGVYLSTSDAFVLYGTSSGALETSPVQAPSTPTTLVATGAVDIDAISPNEAWVLIDQGIDSTTSLVEGLSLASTSTPGPAARLLSSDDEAGFLGAAFTSDGQFALFMHSTITDDMGNNVGTLSAVSTAAPLTPVTLALATGSAGQSQGLGFGGQGRPFGVLGLGLLTGGQLANVLLPDGATDLALGASSSKVVFVDNFTDTLGNLGQVDLHVVDLSTVTPSSTAVASGTTVMAGADPGFATSPDGTSIVYTISFGGSTDGLYVVPVP